MSTDPKKPARISRSREVVVVSGLPRSGTSMAMAMLAAGGLPCVSDAARAADEDNPRGYFEDVRVKRLDGDSDWLLAATGQAVKIVSPLLARVPTGVAYAVVFMRRHLDEVLASQTKMIKRRDERQALADDQMKRHFERHLRNIEKMIENRSDMRVTYIDHREVLRDPRGQARSIAEFLGIPLDVERMAAAVDERLYRNRRGTIGISDPS